MSKSRLALHLVAIMTVALFAFLAISSGATPPKPVVVINEESPPPRIVDNIEKIINSETTSKGNVEEVHLKNPSKDPSATKDQDQSPTRYQDQKPFDALGLVYATTVTKYDEKGNRFDPQENIVIALLREAQKLGGNDIRNLRTDVNITNTQTKMMINGFEQMVIIKTVITTGSALAIKYRN